MVKEDWTYFWLTVKSYKANRPLSFWYCDKFLFLIFFFFNTNFRSALKTGNRGQLAFPKYESSATPLSPPFR